MLTKPPLIISNTAACYWHHHRLSLYWSSMCNNMQTGPSYILFIYAINFKWQSQWWSICLGNITWSTQKQSEISCTRIAFKHIVLTPLRFSHHEEGKYIVNWLKCYTPFVVMRLQWHPMFSDEFRFMVFHGAEGRKGCVYKWHEEYYIDAYVIKQDCFWDGSVMVWDSIAYNVKSPLVIIDGTWQPLSTETTASCHSFSAGEWLYISTW